MNIHQCLLVSSQAGLQDILGYVASALVLGAFYTTSMPRLRCFAVLSNIAFISYALCAGLLPVLVLHCILLPTNVFRLSQLESIRRKGCCPEAFGDDAR